MLKKVIILVCIIIVNVVFAEPVIPKSQFSQQLKEKAGKDGAFIHRKESFPKDYFLVNNNLPFLAGLSLHHPHSSSLNLTQKQIDAIVQIKKQTVPAVVKKSQEIKTLELQLAKNIAIDLQSVQSQFKIVDVISQLRTELTKAHLQCINDVRVVLTKKQYQKLLKYAIKQVEQKSHHSLINQLINLPHPGKLINSGKIKISKGQISRIDKEIKATYVPAFQVKLTDALNLENKIQKLVLQGKTKSELKKQLNTIAQLKTDAIGLRIDALNHLQKILTKEQWQTVNKLTYK